MGGEREREEEEEEEGWKMRGRRMRSGSRKDVFHSEMQYIDRHM